MYTLEFAPQALEDLSKLKKPEPLAGDRIGQWSRRISLKHRLIYEIEETVVRVDVLSAYGHYDDK